jgi:chromosome partitioning protein
VQCVQLYGRLTGPVRDMASRFDDVVLDCGGQDSDELRSARLVAEIMFIPVQASILELCPLWLAVTALSGRLRSRRGGSL